MSRSVRDLVRSHRVLEGAGFEVARPFPTSRLPDLDPFLLLDHFGPVDYAPGQAVGAPSHPHRGFETVTYMLAGQMRHKDSTGREGRLGPGDVQWMTAGAGIVHDESPDPELLRTGGRMEGLQLWVNLPARDKMIEPRYQEIPSASIPEGRSADGLVHVKVLAGEALGARAVIETRTPILYLHFTVAPGGRVEQPVPAEFDVFGYVIRGEGTFGPEGRRATVDDLVRFGDDGPDVVFAASGSEPLEVLVIGGVPLREPIARHGPFVMNTRQEILQAFDDYTHGRMGQIAS